MVVVLIWGCAQNSEQEQFDDSVSQHLLRHAATQNHVRIYSALPYQDRPGGFPTITSQRDVTRRGFRQHHVFVFNGTNCRAVPLAPGTWQQTCQPLRVSRDVIR